ncbi:ribosome small subunit-dependent GTPase A [Falsiruegeria mediterranea]|uniref:Small ribosomal subunit biogenesis GTPase RsgA n=1 Tax=Falsiruegeria mediterranea M17 TaxID=1200281 RepID=A0A2R8CD13_9RHOB|nr:ribosome small subunit-dependent GTPase A [Falsiruegeria mediterranea]SPJ30327.1 Small ribosomal subunit biogenesis GTPase RsgA [Falsiruegeria mediterranea M17]
MSYTYSDLGWSNHFAAQEAAPEADRIFRITAVHRDRLTGFSPRGERVLLPRAGQSTGSFAVGDWVDANQDGLIDRTLERNTLLSRRAAGSGAQSQLIAANVDVLFITSSCNADFNVARLERYLALAHQAGCYPVVVLTKADTCGDPQGFVRQAETLEPFLTVLAVNAHDENDLRQVLAWCPRGQTGALVGSSGVGKTTLTNGLSRSTDATAAIREDDAKGRHTTTARALRPMTNGGWLIDTPGMRALRMLDNTDGIDEVFADLVELSHDCQFSDCSHGSEPGCAIQAAIQAGVLDSDRLRRWQKLLREDRMNSETVAEARARDKAFGKMVRSVMKDKKGRKGL